MRYHPLQIFQPNNYKEALPPEGLKDVIAYYWEIQTGDAALTHHIIPDACVDLVVDCSEAPNLYLSPSALGPQQFELEANQTWFGIRFYPGALAGLLRVDISSLKYETLEMEAIQASLSHKLREVLAGADTFQARQKACNQLLKQLGQTQGLHTHRQVQQAVALIQAHPYTQQLQPLLMQELAISERHLRRLFHQELGLSPKRFARILRAQKALRYLQDPTQAWRSQALYFDQAHMIREIKSMVGMTPGQIQPSSHTQLLPKP